MRFLIHWQRWRLDCMSPVPAITLNIETFKQAMAFALLSLPVFTLAGLWAWGGWGTTDEVQGPAADGAPPAPDQPFSLPGARW